MEKEIAAFLNNQEGGILYIGIDDSGKPVENPDIDATQLKAADRIKNNKSKGMAPAATAVELPAQRLPLLIVKLFSSSAATGPVLDIFKTAGPDSDVVMLTSILMSCTDNGAILRGNFPLQRK